MQTPTSFFYAQPNLRVLRRKHYFNFMKRLLLFFAVLIGFSGIVSAQIGYNDVQFYVEAGKGLDSAGYVVIVISENGELFIGDRWPSQIKESVKNDGQYLNSPQKVFSSISGFAWGTFRNTNYPSMNKGFKKDYNLTTSSKTVYTLKESGGTNAWGQYTAPTVYHLAFSNDGKSLIKWEDGESEYRSYFIRVEKEEFKPKADNLDFLYE